MLDTSKTYTSNKCGQFKIVQYINCNDVLVEFVSTGTVKAVRASHITMGAVRDERMPTVFGIGFIGQGEYKSSVKSKKTKQHIAWNSMFDRCYCHKLHAIRPTYVGCSVATEWHDFQVFARWFDENYIEGYQLDKDIKVKGNKVYGPDTCMYVSRSENATEAHAKNYIFVNPKGDRVEVYNLNEFCKNNNLTQSSMSLVHSGKNSHHKGWKVSV